MEPDKVKIEEHVDWFLKTIKPLLMTWMEHGWKHGLKQRMTVNGPE